MVEIYTTLGIRLGQIAYLQLVDFELLESPRVRLASDFCVTNVVLYQQSVGHLLSDALWAHHVCRGGLALGARRFRGDGYALGRRVLV